MNRFFQSRSAYLGVGLVLGLVIGLNVEGIWPSMPLHAAATCAILAAVDLAYRAIHSLNLGDATASAAICNPFAKYHDVERLKSPSNRSSGDATCSARRELIEVRQYFNAPSS